MISAEQASWKYLVEGGNCFLIFPLFEVADPEVVMGLGLSARALRPHRDTPPR